MLTVEFQMMGINENGMSQGSLHVGYTIGRRLPGQIYRHPPNSAFHSLSLLD